MTHLSVPRAIWHNPGDQVARNELNSRDLATARDLRPNGGTNMNASVRPRGTNWARFVQAITCANLMNLGCGGSTFDDLGKAVGGSGNLNVGGSTGGAAASAGGATTSTCFSRTQNLSIAYQSGAKGCACNSATDESVCVEGVGLICDSNVWIAVYDGPCMPPPGTGGASNGGSSGTGSKSTGGSATGGATGAKLCGAWAGDTCAASEYCAYQAGQLCGGTDAEAICQPRPQVCDDVYAPVCGCDSKTYANSCAAAVAGTGVNAASACTN